MPTPNTEAISLLNSGKDINGSILSFPAYADMPTENIHLVAGLEDVIKEYSIGTAYITTTDFYEKNQDICEAFLKAQQETLALFENDKPKVVSILASLYKLEEPVVEQVLEDMPPTSGFGDYDKQAQLLYQAGICKKEPMRFQDLPEYETLVSQAKG